MKPPAKPLEQGRMSPISDGVTGRIHSNTDVEPNHGTPGTDLSEIQATDRGPFESLELGS
jgi:hypothetical protein